jgi:hypothetical protein
VKNSIDTGLEFYFKGEKFEPSATIDLDTYFREDKDIVYIYDMLAKSIGLNEHRHEYDVMVMEDVVFTNPQGVAKDYVSNAQIDWQGLSEAWKQQHEHAKVHALASKHFSEEELQANPKLMKALLEAAKQNKMG